MNSAQCSTVAILTMVKNLNCCNTRQTNEHQCMLLKTEYIPVLKYSKLHLMRTKFGKIIHCALNCHHTYFLKSTARHHVGLVIFSAMQLALRLTHKMADDDGDNVHCRRKNHTPY